MFKSSLILLFFAICSVHCNVTSLCSHSNICHSYSAINLTLMVKNDTPTCSSKAADCADLLQAGYDESGVYQVWPMNRLTYGKPLDVYCDMDTNGGGWTVIQRRGDFERAIDYFFQDWKSYKEGFGDIQRDFWLGNDNIFALTNQRLYSVRIDMKDVEQTRKYALYDNFWIDDESNKFTLHISDYSGDANDSMIAKHNKQKFSTKDQDNDNDNERHCAALFKGGWWYNGCHSSNLNGLYHKGKHESHSDGINWDAWKGLKESMEWTEIKLRPKHFRSSESEGQN